MELSINGQTYRVDKLNAFAQFHVARRLAPALWALGSGAMSTLKQGGEFSDAVALGAIGPLVEVIAKMSNADSEYVLAACLGVCSRQSGTGWQKVYAEGGGLLFQDIDLPAMMQLTMAAIRENLGNFLDALPTAQPADAGGSPG